MWFKYFLIVFLMSVGSCAIRTEKDYWHIDNRYSSIRLSCQYRGEQLEGFCEKYYSNGQLMSKAIYKNDKLVEIISVYDTIGKKLYCGNLKNGNGYAISYNDEYCVREFSGYYIDGEREGWWIYYNYRGEAIDSFYFVNSVTEDLANYRNVMY